MKTGVVSVADETCAILAFGGALAALTHARTTGVGQKVDCSLLGGQIRLMGWTLTTAMWRNRDPVTGQARVAGTRERPAMSASFNDRDGKPFVFQLARDQWKEAMAALGFYEADGEGRLRPSRRRHGIGRERGRRCWRSSASCSRPARATTGWRSCAAATSSRRRSTRCSRPSNDPDVVANGYVAEVDYPKYGKRLKVHGTPWQFSETPAKIGIAPELGEHNDEVLASLGYSEAQIADFRERKVI